MLTVYGDLESGNCYKVKLLLELLGQPYRWNHIDVVKREMRSVSFRSLNPQGKIPVLQTETGEILPESNAILWYLAEGSAYLPPDRLARAQILQWMFFEQTEHEPNIASARFIERHVTDKESYRDRLATMRADGMAALSVMDDHLKNQDFFVGGNYSIADIALYAYTHVADEGGFDLTTYPAIQRWLDRVASHPRHVRMKYT